MENFKQKEIFQFGATKQDILLQYVKKYISVEVASGEIEIIQYKFIIDEEKVKKQFHFYQNKLFAYSEIYSYLKPDNEDKLMQLSLHQNQDLISFISPGSVFDFNNNIRLIYKKDVELAFHLLDANSILSSAIDALHTTMNNED